MFTSISDLKANVLSLSFKFMACNRQLLVNYKNSVMSRIKVMFHFSYISHQVACVETCFLYLRTYRLIRLSMHLIHQSQISKLNLICLQASKKVILAFAYLNAALKVMNVLVLICCSIMKVSNVMQFNSLHGFCRQEILITA